MEEGFEMATNQNLLCVDITMIADLFKTNPDFQDPEVRYVKTSKLINVCDKPSDNPKKHLDICEISGTSTETESETDNCNPRNISDGIYFNTTNTYRSSIENKSYSSPYLGPNQTSKEVEILKTGGGDNTKYNMLSPQDVKILSLLQEKYFCVDSNVVMENNLETENTFFTTPSTSRNFQSCDESLKRPLSLKVNVGQLTDNDGDDRFTCDETSDETIEIVFEEEQSQSLLQFSYDDNLPLSVIKENDIIRTILTEVVEKVVGVERQLNFTKEGTVRKRKRYDIPLKDRKKMKLIKIVDKHDLKENCNENCKKLCQKNINRDRQKYINTEYWKLNKQEQKSFIFSKVEKTIKKERTMQFVRIFLWPQLAMIFLRHICEDTSSLKPKIDNRGQFKRANKVNTDIIRDHIQTFNPSIHHYRREHAPLRLYLPTDINIKMMYDDFKLKHGMNIYELYRKEVAAMNISFTKLGHQECFACETFSLHSKATGHTKETAEDTCQECTTWKEHQQKYREARKEYAKDGAKEDELCFSADLQKDFLDCVKSSNSKKVNLKEVKLDGFYTFTDYTYQQTLKKIVPRPYLSDMVFVRFNKGEKHLQYKTSFHGDFIDLKFLMAKYYKCSTLPGPAVKEKERGITSERKNNIINKLADIIPENRMAFWRNLAKTNDETD
ncbi:unnamed protein product [Ceutorhynchus assimilis]|uniref:Uncharacterized protein n=1 Tax=Ceutorhynchus assimilis TaxID=467358 RepID=A0A9N9QS81_9CUCU|nr:unnamed protein product [Ceutorhynchus assimilis]